MQRSSQHPSPAPSATLTTTLPLSHNALLPQGASLCAGKEHSVSLLYEDLHTDFMLVRFRDYARSLDTRVVLWIIIVHEERERMRCAMSSFLPKSDRFAVAIYLGASAHSMTLIRGVQLWIWGSNSDQETMTITTVTSAATMTTTTTMTTGTRTRLRAQRGVSRARRRCFERRFARTRGHGADTSIERTAA